jgi:hypothetical protein
LVLVAAVVATLGLSAVPASAIKALDSCKFVTLKDARTVLGANTRNLRSPRQVCNYASTEGTMRVQVWDKAINPHPPGSNAIESGGTTVVNGVPAWYLARGSNGLGTITLVAFRNGRLYSVVLGGTTHDRANAKVALAAALNR